MSVNASTPKLTHCPSLSKSPHIHQMCRLYEPTSSQSILHRAIAQPGSDPQSNPDLQLQLSPERTHAHPRATLGLVGPGYSTADAEFTNAGMSGDADVGAEPGLSLYHPTTSQTSHPRAANFSLLSRCDELVREQEERDEASRKVLGDAAEAVEEWGQVEARIREVLGRREVGREGEESVGRCDSPMG